MAFAPLPACFAGAPAPTPAPLPLVEPVLDKNAWVLRALRLPAGRQLLQDEPALERLRAAQRSRLLAGLESCATKVPCLAQAGRLTSEEVTQAAGALRERCRALRTACAEVARALRASGTRVLDQQASDEELLTGAWVAAAAVLDRIVRTWGLGEAPRYASIDGLGHAVDSPAFGRLLRTAVRAALAETEADPAFYAGTAGLARRLLDADGRDEAGRHEPLERGENRLARRGLRGGGWGRYPYSVILVPGQGPELPGQRLAPEGRLRLALAVTRWRQGAAPIIVVSGGYVHPARTPFNEALEMKRALTQDHGVPESAILVEPHARHTTTNLRNTARLIYRYGLPFDRPALVVSDEQQVAYIASAGFDERNRRETGVLPYSTKTPLSPTELAFTPDVAALQAGFEDPLDP